MNCIWLFNANNFIKRGFKENESSLCVRVLSESDMIKNLRMQEQMYNII